MSRPTSLLHRHLAPALTLSAALLGVACGSSSSAPSAPSSPAAPPSAPKPNAPTFAEIYADVLTPNQCTSCHAPGGEGAFLDLSTQAIAYTNLVGVKASGPACSGSDLDRVVAGDAATSLLYAKISEANPPCGVQMPYGCSGSSCMAESEQSEIQAWINAGALAN
jgi:hypothetical protein